MSITCHKGMWLKKCSNLVPDIRKKPSFMKSAHGKNSVFYAFKYDIKEFFTNVVIAHVMPALQFFIYNNSVIKEGHIWIHKRNFKLVFMTKPILENSFTNWISNKLLISYLMT